jgi:arylsulfatase A-like enzyme/cytochrome c-type biogenesis protein CcmH/NrfG
MSKTGRKNGRAGRTRGRRRRRTRAYAAIASGVCAAIVATVLLVRPGARPTTISPRDERPDVLLITIDTLRADAVGAYGHSGNPTPWIDRLAAAGARFQSARAQTPLTLPSHATVLTGRYPFAHGVRDNAGFRMAPEIATLPVWLRARGYRTGAFVSAFPLDQRFGLGRGFDVYDDRLAVTPRRGVLEQERAAVDTVARARAWLDANNGHPSFCWVHLYEPHYPYAPPEPYASRFAGDPYEGEVAAADAALASLLRPILDAGKAATDVVVLTGDHGESLGAHGEATHGIFAYDATLRVPLIVYAPGLVRAGSRADAARHVDIAPTILDLLSIPLPQDLDGRSLRQPSNGQTPVAYFEALSGTFNRGWAPVRGIVRDGLKFIDLPIPELYDLAADPGELRNLAPERGADIRALRTVLAQFPLASAQPRAESASTRERLSTLGYIAGGSSMRRRYTDADDPKRLMSVDTMLQAIVSQDLAGNASGAIATARTVAAQYPRMPLAWLELAQLQRETGDVKSAIASLTHAHEIDPSNVQAAALLGASLTQDGRAAEAVATLEPLARTPDADVEILRTLALAKARGGSADEALHLLERARAANSNNPQVFVDEATVDLIANRRPQARAALEEALRRDPDLPAAHSTLAALLADEGRGEEAAAHWRSAAARDPGEYSHIFALAVAQARAGHTAQARIAFEFFVASAPAALYSGQIAEAHAWLEAPSSLQHNRVP